MRRFAFIFFLLALPCSAQLPIASLERTEPVVYSKEIAPLLKRSCLACHNTTKAKAKLNLESVEAILAGSADGPVLVAGKADESLLFTAAAHLEDPIMPPEKNKSNAPNLTPEELALLRLWIDQGAKDDGGADAAKVVEFAAMSERVNAIYAVALSHDNVHAAAGRGNQVTVYHLPSGSREAELVDAHQDIVGALAFGRGGLLASAGFRNVKLWRRPPAALVAELEDSGEVPTAVATDAEGSWAAVAESSGAVKLHALSPPGSKPRAFKDHGGAVTGVAITRSGHLVSASLDATVGIRPLQGEAPAKQIKLPSPIHALSLIGNGERAFCACEDGVVRIVSITEATPGIEFKGHTGKVTSVAALGADGNQFVSAGHDRQLKIWNVANPAAPLRGVDTGAAVKAAAVSADGGRIATIGDDKKLRIWNAADLKKLAEVQTDGAAKRELSDAQASQKLVTATRDQRSKALVAADKSWNDERAKLKAITEAEAKAATELQAHLETLEISEAEERRQAAEVAVKTAAKHPQLAAAQEAQKKATEAVAKQQAQVDGAQRKHLEAVRTRELALRLIGRAGETKAAAEAALAASEAAVQNATKTVEAATKAVAEAVKDFRALSFSPAGDIVYAASEDGHVYSWGAASGIPGGWLSGHGSPIAAMAAAPAGHLLCASDDKRVRLLDPSPDWQLERTIGAIDDPEVFADRVNAVAFSADGRFLATGGGVPSRGGELKVFRVRDGVLVSSNTEAHSDAISAVEFSPDGRFVAAAGTDRFVNVFSVVDGSLYGGFEGHTNHVLDVAWRADGLVLASSGADHVVKLWDVEAISQKETIKGHSKAVTAVDFLGYGSQLVSSSGDKSVRLANKPLPESGGFVHTAEASADGSMIAAGGQDSVLRIWRASDRKILLKLQ